MVRHARWVRETPPLNPEMGSYLSSISVLLLGYQLSGDSSLYRTAYERAQSLKTDRLSLSFEEASSPADHFRAPERVSHRPRSRERPDRVHLEHHERPWHLRGDARLQRAVSGGLA